ncbi:hypothetical protein Q4577_01690 [Marinovum sp. 2_MG-2023]|nr:MULTISPECIES: hypothetical protein [Roseobacteraceae]MCJ7871855.1 hypothetical protein [Phaeobacter sp. J2-8]MDO6728711.1 hypothetical protein [Marinovum sp. 2_MG-2023]MDO6777873.1 hypothetical protein [Marinovum sp. 1_MG-2023]
MLAFVIFGALAGVGAAFVSLGLGMSFALAFWIYVAVSLACMVVIPVSARIVARDILHLGAF